MPSSWCPSADNPAHLVLDIGGTWIKSAAVFENEFRVGRNGKNFSSIFQDVRRLPSPSRTGRGFREVLASIHDTWERRAWKSVVISTAGVVNAHGTKVTRCSSHLDFLRREDLATCVGELLHCPLTIINDAEAFMLGAAVLGNVPRIGNVSGLVIGTGLGFACVRDGRWWRPYRSLSLLGSIRYPGGSFDSLVNCAALAAQEPSGDLATFLSSPRHSAGREAYWKAIGQIITTASILHAADCILIGGGLCDAARAANIDIEKEIKAALGPVPPELDRTPEICALREGNTTQLIGAAALACEGIIADRTSLTPAFGNLPTEQPHPASTNLHLKSEREIIDILWRAEEEAGRALSGAVEPLSKIASHIVKQLPAGGRIIYVGAGTSGRLAAIDAVEIPCTFGEQSDRVVAVMAGGVADAALTIEGNREEDGSSVADMILLSLTSADTVIGISASGTAFFVQSALAYASRAGAATALICAGSSPERTPWDWIVELGSGPEIIAGSTRMKAGTSSKKAINFLTTTVFAKSEKVHGPWLVHMACLNEKLEARACRILSSLFDISETEAARQLTTHHGDLRKTIFTLSQGVDRNALPTTSFS